MKKLISILLCAITILAFAVTGCGEVNDKNNVDDKKDEVLVEDVEIKVTPVKTEIQDERDQAVVTVTVVALKDLEIGLGTSSLGKGGAIWLECYTEIDGVEYKLYDDDYGFGHTCDIYEFTLSKGESITRTFILSRLPVHLSNPEKYETKPKGEYKVRVRFQTDSSWTETDIIITAK